MDTAPNVEFDSKTANYVEQMAAIGLSLSDIATVVDIDPDSMLRLYEENWKKGRIKANAQVSKRLFELAVENGNTEALKLWAKARLEWNTHKSGSSQDVASLLKISKSIYCDEVQ